MGKFNPKRSRDVLKGYIYPQNIGQNLHNDGDNKMQMRKKLLQFSGGLRVVASPRITRKHLIRL